MSGQDWSDDNVEYTAADYTDKLKKTNRANRKDKEYSQYANHPAVRYRERELSRKDETRRIAKLVRDAREGKLPFTEE